MTTSTNTTRYRVSFLEITIDGDIERSTMWYRSIAQCEKWMSEPGAKIVTKEVEKMDMKAAIKAKFGNI